MSDMIIDPMFPAKEPCPHHQHNHILFRNFGVPAQITATSWHACRVTNLEILRMYSITFPHTHLNITLKYHTIGNILEDLLLFSLP